MARPYRLQEDCFYHITSRGNDRKKILQGGDREREDEEGEQEDKESGKEVNFYFPELTPHLPVFTGD